MTKVITTWCQSSTNLMIRGEITKIIIILLVPQKKGNPYYFAQINSNQQNSHCNNLKTFISNVHRLLAQKEDMWGDKVTVISSDMRQWDPPNKADILVSELLGSFGDNELSPECLDGAQHLLKGEIKMLLEVVQKFKRILFQILAYRYRRATPLSSVPCSPRNCTTTSTSTRTRQSTPMLTTKHLTLSIFKTDTHLHPFSLSSHSNTQTEVRFFLRAKII